MPPAHRERHLTLRERRRASGHDTVWTVATTTLLQGEKSATRTTIFLKILMAASGALFVFYVLMHMYGNLKIFAGQQAFDHYAASLRELLTPILPHGGFLWIFRVLLILALIVHAYAALTLWSRANGARPSRYVVPIATRYAMRTKMMRWGGIALLLFVILHLVQFTVPKVNFNGQVSASRIGDSPYQLVVAGFQLWWVTLIYLLALAALAMHLFHGVWSAAQTLGWANSPRARGAAKGLAHLIAAVTVIGFALPPVAILLGLVPLN